MPQSIIFFILFLCIHFLSSESINFTYNGFNDSTNILQQGTTIIHPTGALRLTNTTQNIIGHAFYAHPIPMIINNNVSSFSTHFIFQIRPSGGDHGGYGLAFTISPSPGFPNAAAGHYLGVFSPDNNGNASNHIFMVEFDTVDGFQEDSDSDGNHVAININGMTPNVSSLAAYYPGNEPVTEAVFLESGEPNQAWIDYDGVRGEVNVTVAPINIRIKPNRPLITLAIDLSRVLVQDVFVGFSAATGIKSSSHYILGWSFNNNGSTAVPLNVNRLPYIPPDRLPSSRNRVNRAFIFALTALIFVLLASLGTIIYRRTNKFEVLEDWELDCPHRFKYKDLYKATKGFKQSEMIGAGGFGSVYKGLLPTSGAEVAVKRIKSNNTLQGFREFAAEIESLGRLRHKHLVNLQGWCKHTDELLLVYDYVSNGSLDALLYNRRSVLSWDHRFKIAKGIAAGLLYLHEEWEQVVIHRDVKSSNVLIDQDMNPRLGDFGLARLYDHGKNSHTTNVVGTIGYIAPELSRIGKASTSSDVFAYGILLLELACGRSPVVYEADRNMILVDWVVECMESGSIFDVVDRKLSSVYESEEMELVLGLGLLCSHPKAEARPTMREVVNYLNGDETLPVFDKLSSAGSRRVNEVTERLLALGLSTDESSSTYATSYNSSSVSVGQISSGSIDYGR